MKDNDTFKLEISKERVKDFIFVFFEAFVVLCVVIFGIDFFNGLPRAMEPINGANYIAVANSFMVFVTFIFVVATVAITIGGIFFTRWWGREKKQVLSENWSEMLTTIKENPELMKKLKEDLFSDSLEEMMKEHILAHTLEIDASTISEIKESEKRIISKLKLQSDDTSIPIDGDGIILDKRGN